MTPIRVLLVDDQRLIRQGLTALLQLAEDLEIVGEADNGQTAITQVEHLQPDVVLMDVRMPIMDGIAATQAILQHSPTIKVLMLTTFDDRDSVTRALQTGAVGYLLKDLPSEELAQAIRAAHQGYSQLSPGILQTIMSQQPPSPSALEPPPGFETLTPREREVLQLLGQGLSNREIAQTLHLSEGTVKNHVTSILGRLNLRDRTQAALLAQSLPLNEEM